MTEAHLIAEVCSNHGRSLERSLEFVDAAAELGFGSIKFQQFRIRRLFAPEALRAEPRLLQRRAWELPLRFNPAIAERARERGIRFGTTPFYLRAVELLEGCVDFFKIASYQVLWEELLREVGGTGKPVVLATGMATLVEVERAIAALKEGGCEDLALLHCVSAYPTPRHHANLAAIRTLREAFGLPAGWSDHTADQALVARAIRRWDAQLVELHLDLDGRGAEHAMGHCWLPRQVRRLSEALEREEALPERSLWDGDGRKLPREIEMRERAWRSDPADGLRPVLEERARLRYRRRVA